MADLIKETLAEFANEVMVKDSGYEIIVKKGCRSVSVRGHPRLHFSTGFWAQGVEYFGGEADSTEVAPSIIAFLVEKASLGAMASRFPWFKPEETGLAHERGPAEYVSHAWSGIEEGWSDGMSRHYPLASCTLVPLIQEASKRPELRQLFPFTSHFSLHFSRTTGYPFSRDCPYAEPVGKGLYGKGLFWRIKRLMRGLYRVTSANGTVLCAKVDVIHAVDTLVAALPPNCGPAVNGTADDTPLNGEMGTRTTK
ncbi:MAG TPA: DUF6193 family natural product biosynthesis protein [Candidatus Saccharimonadales bacterium]|nr:DUF6193 family natural product biosynthesis protein [Candidatus Saccharimonadales bacterium]